MPSNSFFSFSVASLAVAAGLVYSDVRLGEIFSVMKVESIASVVSLQSDAQAIRTSAHIIAGIAKGQMRIARSDLEILGRDIQVEASRCKDLVAAKLSPAVATPVTQPNPPALD